MGAYTDFHRRSIEEREEFWAEQAQLIDWHEPFERVLDYSRPPFARWFVGGLTNLCHNAVDRHLAARGDQKALIYISTETGQERAYTYRELHAEVNRCAAMIRSLGVGKGDRVLIYMPMIPEAVFAMLACARLGRDPFGGVRRLRRAQPRRAHRRRAAEADDHRRRRHARRARDPLPGRCSTRRSGSRSRRREKVIVVNRGIDPELEARRGARPRLRRRCASST